MTIGGRSFDFEHSVFLMGILNATPDSFSDGGRFLDPERALDHALKMQEEGADLIDVGGESTRPGSEPVPAEEELKRVLPVLRKIVPRLRIPVSIDTRKSEIAREALAAGAALVNDVSSLLDPRMGAVISDGEVPVILMHMRGEPKTMQKDVQYEDVVGEILRFLETRIQQAIKSGIPREKILVDPGIGFGKRFEDNLEILSRLSEFKKMGPVVFGASRKSFVRSLTGDDPQDVAAGSAVVALLAAERGASILRVHDIKQAKSFLRLVSRKNLE